MDIRGKNFKWRITPEDRYIKAEIFYLHETLTDSNDKPIEMNAISESFGGWLWLRQINEKDWCKAREWIDTQMKSMFRANKDL